MIDLPIEFSNRLRKIASQIEADLVDDSDIEFISKMMMMNKIAFITEVPNFNLNGKFYGCPSFKIDSIEQLSLLLDKKYDEGQLFCFYRLLRSPTMYNATNFSSSHIMMVRGAFVPTPDNFELRDIIDRNTQIEKILN